MRGSVFRLPLSIVRTVFPSAGSIAACAIVTIAAACSPATTGDAGPDVGPAPDAGTFQPAQASMRRLTQAQYRNSVHDVFGDDVLLTRSLEPDSKIGGFFAVGASATSISARGVEQYEATAYDVAEQALLPAHRAALVSCQPAAVMDDACARTYVTAVGRRLWRRPLTEPEIAELVAIAGRAAVALSDFHGGLQFATASMLQSANFLFRVEIGEPDPDHAGTMRFSAAEMASRLSFFLWDGPPDEMLLAAAGDGSLATDAGVAAQVTRMLAEPRAHRGLRNFVSEWLGLEGLSDLVRDPTAFTAFSSDLGPSAREETLRGFERIVFDTDSDFRDILTTRETFLNRKLASIYAVRAPVSEGFGLATLPSDSPRRGLLGQASVLALHAHPVASSPTLRGRFVRQTLLCQEQPPPPVNVNTGIPEPSPSLRTLRERLAAHAVDYCATCHHRMDGVGFGLENFDAIGRYRRLENGVVVDATGTIDGRDFNGADQLAQAVHDHADLGPCLAQRLYRYATGHVETAGEQGEIGRLGWEFARGGYRVRALMSAIANNPAFRRAAAREQ